LRFCPEHLRRSTAAAFLPFFFILASGAVAQTPVQPEQPASTDASPSTASTDASPSTASSDATPSGATSPSTPASPSIDNFINDDRILGLIPNFLTVEDPTAKVPPLTVKQKFQLFAKETFDPFTGLSAAAGAALSQVGDDNPKYGEGAGPYAERFGAAVADITTQNFFQDAVLASLFHEDPRYFRRGPEFGVWYRVGYALSRVVVTRTDAGKDRFNFSGILGMSMGIALSNAYYPDSSVRGSEVAYRFATSAVATALTNLLPEFWPDIHEKFFHHKPHNQPPSP
jgi:hypothetical protein